MTRRRRAAKESGAALLAVLWLTAALAAIAFTVASTVRAETERASTAADALRASFVAAGAVERGALWMHWGPANYHTPDGRPMFYMPPMPHTHFEFPDGAADVDFIPESSKLNINRVTPDDLTKLLAMVGAPAPVAMGISAGIVNWRSPAPGGGYSPLGQTFLASPSSFRARPASIEEIAETLLIRGMTPEIFYGGYRTGDDGQLVPYGGLRDCVSVYGSLSQLDVNTVQPAVMAVLGMNPGAIQALVARRRAVPFAQIGDAAIYAEGAPGFGRLIVGGETVWTIRATARYRLPNGKLSDLKKTVSAMVKLMPAGYDPEYQFMRWYDDSPPFLEQAPAAVPQPADSQEQSAP